MNVVANALFVLNFLVIICNVSTEENNWEPKVNQKVINQQETNFDYWEIDHNEASAIYYEPADKFFVKPFEFSKKFVISNPRTEESQIQSIGKTYTSSTKEKRNSLSQNTTSCDICVDETVTDDKGRNVLLDIGITPFSTSRNTDSEELTTELLDVEHIQLTEQKLAECIDLHLFKNKEVIENWKSLLSESKIQIYSQFSEVDLNKEIQRKCKHLDDIIEKNLDLLRRSMPRRTKNSTSITTPISAATPNNVDEKGNTSDHNALLIEQTTDTFEDSTTVSHITTSQYARNKNENVSSNLTTEIDNNKSETSMKSSNQLAPNNRISIGSNILQTIDKNDFQQISDSSGLHKQHRGNQKVLKESEIEIPTLFTKELLNGSVISDAHGIETLPNKDFEYFDIPQGKHLQPFNDNTNLTSLADDLKNTEIKERNSTTLATNKPRPTTTTPPPPYRNATGSLNFTLAQTTPRMAQELDFLNKSVADSFTDQKNYTDEMKNDSTRNKQVNDMTTNTRRKDIHVNHVILEEPKTESKLSSLNGTLYFDFNGALVPTHFVQNPEGRINIAIDGKSFCDNVLSNFQSVILQRICKSEYENNVARTNKS